MSSTNRKEQILNSAGGLAANLFEKFNKLKQQQQNEPSVSTTPPTSSNLLNNLTIGFHKNSANSQLNTTNNPNLLIINDDGIDDSNIDPLNENETKSINKLLLTKSKSVNTPNDTSNTTTPTSNIEPTISSKQITQSQSDYDLNNNTTSVNSNSNNSSLAPSTSRNSKMTNSSSLFKLSSGFIDDLKADIILKTNSYVDEAEDALRRRFLKKKKSSDSLQITPTTQTPLAQTPSTPSSELTTLITGNSDKCDNTNLTGLENDSNDLTITEIEPVKTQETNNSIVIKEENNFNVNTLIWIPIVASIIILLILKVLNATNSSFLSIILFYLCGFLTGAVIVSLVIAFILLKYNLISIKNEHQSIETKKEEKNKLHSLLIQTAMQKPNKNFDGVYKGWMNELREKYDPDTYFLNKTRSVYVSLDGNMLRIQTTTSKIPKRAIHSEKIGYVQFNDQRIYDLTESECNLLPKELVRKRYWSKKYPLCLKGIKLVSSNSITRKASLSQSSSSYNIENNINSDDLQLEENTLILFARTDREKEEWYKLFKKSSAKNLLDSATYLNQKKINTTKSSSKLITSSNNDTLVFSSTSPSVVSYDSTNDKLIYKLVNELDTLKQQETDNATSSLETNNSLNELSTQTENGLLYDTSLNFMNTFLIRMFNDFFTHQFWISKIRTKMQNKLNTLKTPYFMEELRIIDLDLGFMIPLIKQTSEPWYDDKGLWCHLDIDYSGGIQILISTKLNLMKLKANDQESQLEEVKKQENVANSNKKRHLGMINSDEEDSAESSGDEYVHTDNTDNGEVVETANKGKKILNIVNKIASSNYFQKATEMKYIKKAMENVSNCQLLLNVEVKKIAGTLALNIPPHPSDRIWYGFVSAPQMVLIATPQVGDKEVSYSAISDWIAEKLKQEFQKVLVFPNMDDFYIPILNSELEYKNW